jgi:hypothetical protein
MAAKFSRSARRAGISVEAAGRIERGEHGPGCNAGRQRPEKLAQQSLLANAPAKGV